MSKITNTSDESADRSALRNRVYSFYRYCKKRAFEKCFTFIDPALKDKGAVEQEKYINSLSDFMEYYGTIQLVVTKIDLFSGVKVKNEEQTFGYLLIVWKDAKHVPHLFQERWIKHEDTWYTRVAGYVTPDFNGEADEAVLEQQQTPAKRSE